MSQEQFIGEISENDEKILVKNLKKKRIESPSKRKSLGFIFNLTTKQKIIIISLAFLIFIIVLIIIVSSSSESEIDNISKVCRNIDGKEVDWYSIFLMPTSVASDKQLYYGYYDPTLTDIQFHLYEEKNFPPTRITKYVTESVKKTNLNYFFWNDDRTTKGGSQSSCSNSKAHAKGSLVYDSDNGAFLLHSLPRFPTRTTENELLNEMPSNTGSYGQTFFCISVTKSTAEKIAQLLNYVNVNINKSVEKDRINSNPDPIVESLIANEMKSDYPDEHKTVIYSKEGEKFDFIGKNYKNVVIPYDTTLRELYKDDFYVRTWTRPSLAPSIFNEEYKLVNILQVKYYNQYQYVGGKEHSKWAIAANKDIVCFSDLNHTESQNVRGGHIVCFTHKKLHSIMKESIVQLETQS